MKIIWQRLVAQVLEFILVSGVEWILANLSNQKVGIGIYCSESPLVGLEMEE